jgi:dihydroflavonol-4-reductase
MKALVTGAAGFIGSHVVRALVEAGHAVRALHLPGEELRNLAGLDVERVAGDVTDADDMRRAVAGCDWVFHLAAIYALWTRKPERMRKVNVEGTRTVLEAARAAGVRRVVHTSSIARFGGQGRGQRATEESAFALGPTGDLYSRTKFEAHEVARAFAADLDVVIVAPTGPIGPGDVGPTPTGRLLLRALTLPVVVVADTVTNFAHVRDIARGHLLAAERGRRGESYLLGHRDLTLAELARLALARFGVRRPIVRVPFSVARMAAHGAVAAANVTGRAPLITPAAVAIAELGLAADCGKAVRELGLPQTPIEDALHEALVWFAAEGYLPHGALSDSRESRYSRRT